MARARSPVSIHATLAGGDAGILCLSCLPQKVSIHATLAGGDYGNEQIYLLRCRFLSTPPSRVATVVAVVGGAVGVEVSIHATLAGGDEYQREA